MRRARTGGFCILAAIPPRQRFVHLVARAGAGTGQVLRLRLLGHRLLQVNRSGGLQPHPAPGSRAGEDRGRRQPAPAARRMWSMQAPISSRPMRTSTGCISNCRMRACSPMTRACRRTTIACCCPMNAPRPPLQHRVIREGYVPSPRKSAIFCIANPRKNVILDNYNPRKNVEYANCNPRKSAYCGMNLFLATSLVSLGRRNMNPRFSRSSIPALLRGCIVSKSLRHHYRHTVMIQRSNCISMMLGCWQRPWI